MKNKRYYAPDFKSAPHCRRAVDSFTDKIQKKSFISFMLALLVFLSSFITINVLSVPIDDKCNVSDGIDFDELMKGGIYFGKYRHALADGSKETEATPVLYKIMGDEFGDGNLTLMSKYVLDKIPFFSNDYFGTGTYGILYGSLYRHSFVRHYLNDIFYYNYNNPPTRFAKDSGGDYIVENGQHVLETVPDPNVFTSVERSVIPTANYTVGLYGDDNEPVSAEMKFDPQYNISDTYPSVIENEHFFLPWLTQGDGTGYWSTSNNRADKFKIESVIPETDPDSVNGGGQRAYYKGETNSSDFVPYSSPNLSYNKDRPWAQAYLLFNNNVNKVSAEHYNQDSGLRPMMKIDSNRIVMAEEIKSVTGGYTPGSSGSKNYKLTLVQDDGGALAVTNIKKDGAGAALNTNDAVATLIDEDFSFTAAKSSPQNKLHYKIVSYTNENLVEKNECAFDGTHYSIPTGGLNGTYEIYIWEQEESSDSSNIASYPIHFYLTAGEGGEFGLAVPKITYQPNAVYNIKTLTPLELRVAAVSRDQGLGSTLSYQWFLNDTESTYSAAEPITGETNPILNLYFDAQDDGTRYYFCEVTNTNPSYPGEHRTVKSEITKVEVTLVDAAGPIVISPTPWQLARKPDTEKLLYVDAGFAEGDISGILSFEWFRRTENDPAHDSTTVPKDDSAYLVGTDKQFIAKESIGGLYYYYCKVTNTDNTATGKKTGTAYSEIYVVDFSDDAIELRKNFIKNSSFEDGLSDWMITGTGALIEDEKAQYPDEYCLSNKKTALKLNLDQTASQTMALEEKTTYNLSFVLLGGHLNYKGVTVEIIDGDANILYGPSIVRSVDSDETFRREGFEFTTKENTDVTVKFTSNRDKDPQIYEDEGIRIDVVELFEGKIIKNIALDKSAVLNKGIRLYPSDNVYPSNAFDGRYDSPIAYEWGYEGDHPTDPEKQASLTVDLLSKAQIYKMVLYFTGNPANHKFTVEMSDDLLNWEPVWYKADDSLGNTFWIDINYKYGKYEKRFVRITRLPGSKADMILREFEIYGEYAVQPQRSLQPDVSDFKNIAIGKRVTFSSKKYSFDINTSERDIGDHDARTGWEAKPYDEKDPDNPDAKFPQWIKYDFGERTDITGTRLIFSGFRTLYRYRIKVSDDDAVWQTVVNMEANTRVTGSTLSMVDLFNTVKTRYVMVEILEVTPKTDLMVMEFEVFGKDTNINVDYDNIITPQPFEPPVDKDDGRPEVKPTAEEKDITLDFKNDSQSNLKYRLTLSGILTTENGIPLSEIEVSLGGKTVRTDRNGYFSFSKIPANSYAFEFLIDNQKIIVPIRIDDGVLIIDGQKYSSGSTGSAMTLMMKHFDNEVSVRKIIGGNVYKNGSIMSLSRPKPNINADEHETTTTTTTNITRSFLLALIICSASVAVLSIAGFITIFIFKKRRKF